MLICEYHISAGAKVAQPAENVSLGPQVKEGEVSRCIDEFSVVIVNFPRTPN